jgi:hypothetical protein
MTQVRLPDGQMSGQVSDRVCAYPHDEIVRLEQRIEELEARIESCRKFMLASRVTIVGGGIVFTAILIGAIRFEPGTMAGAIAAFLGGIVVWGSNRSTSKEAAKELVAAREDRRALAENDQSAC